MPTYSYDDDEDDDIDDEPTSPDPAPPSPRRREPIPTIDPSLIRPFRAVRSSAAHPRAPIIEGILRRGEVANLIAPPKSRKTYLAIDLALSVVTGRTWLGLATTPSTVLYIDAELHPETFAARVVAVQRQRGIADQQIDGRLHVLQLRGVAATIDSLVALAKDTGLQLGLIVIDAKYRLQVGEGADANSNSAETAFFNRLDELAASTGAAIIVVHHDAKGDPRARTITDRGSGAGAQSRAADAHLVLTPSEGDADVVALAGVVRSFGPMSPIRIRWTYPVFEVDVVEPDEIADDGSFTTDGLRSEIRRYVTSIGEPRTRSVIVTQLRERLGVSRRRLDDALSVAEAEGDIVMYQQGRHRYVVPRS